MIGRLGIVGECERGPFDEHEPIGVALWEVWAYNDAAAWQRCYVELGGLTPANRRVAVEYLWRYTRRRIRSKKFDAQAAVRDWARKVK